MQTLDLFEQDFDPELPFGTLSGFAAGVDEVGRGPLIGNVVVAAVVLPKNCDLPVNDSKKLSEKKREALFDEIKEQAVCYSIAQATPEEIDELNILQATMLAMSRAIANIQAQFPQVQGFYIDGNRCPNINASMKAVVKGDGKIAEIGAASILAKVTRDRQMRELDEKYPHYQFANHKGYPTKVHLELIKKHGLIDGYRKSFKPVAALIAQ